jgi:citrate lyase beta subunit
MLEKASIVSKIWRIADLEDSVSEVDYVSAVANLTADIDYNIDFVRINPQKNVLEHLEKRVLTRYKRIIYPKIRDRVSWYEMLLLQQKYHLEIFLLVEHPWLLMNLPNMFDEIKGHVKYIGFGHHDYAKELDVKEDAKSVEWARLYLLNFAKALNIEAVDIASMNIKDQKAFVNECTDGHSLGFDGKFVIHPNQVSWLSSANFYSDEDIKWAENIIAKTPSDQNLVSVFVIDGQVIEKPHIARAQKIINFIK